MEMSNKTIKVIWSYEKVLSLDEFIFHYFNYQYPDLVSELIFEYEKVKGKIK